MEVALAVGTLKVAYHLLIVGIKVDQVPNAVRRCIELVRTCHRDLEDLIKLRNESLPMLESKPAILQRINSIIENAHNGLLEVARLVEKLRPEAHDGSSPLMGRLEWIFIDSREFSSQEPLISRQHSSVIAELNFLRQLILLTPLIEGSGSAKDKGGTETAQTKRPAIAWDNVGLLDEMLGGRKQNLPHAIPTPVPAPMSPPSTTTTPQIAPVGRVASPTPTLSDPPPPYSSPKPTFGFPVPVSVAPASNTNHPLVYNAVVPAQGHAFGGAGGNLYTGHAKASTDVKRTTFDADGISFLFGDLKIAPSPAAASTTATLPKTQPTTSTSLATGTTASYPWTVPGVSSSNTQTNVPQDLTSHHATSNANDYLQSSYLPTASGAHTATRLQQQSQPQSQQQTPNMHPWSQPHPHPHPQGIPLPAKDEPVYEVKALSTIPQELIHRHDGVKSPPLQPLFSPLLGNTTLANQPRPSVPAITPHPGQHQTWFEPRHQASVPSSEAQGNPGCCSSCGSARNSLSNVPTGITSRPSGLNLAQSFRSSDRNQATYQPLNQHQHHDQSVHISDASMAQTRAEKVRLSHSDQYNPAAHCRDSIQSNPSQQAALRPRPSTVDFQNHTFADASYFPHTGYPQHGETRTPDPSYRYSTPQPTTRTTQMHVAPTFDAQPHSNLPDSWRHTHTPQPPLAAQSSVPSSDEAGNRGPSNPNPTFQTFATTREHWKPETLTTSWQAHARQNPPQGEIYPNHQLIQPQAAGQPSRDEYQNTTNRADRPLASKVTNMVFETEAAELYGSSALMPGLEQQQQQQHEAGRAHWYVKTHDRMVHTEIHELSSVKFAPDPVELD
ncbi:hypothetical protein V8F33_003683 [Rhypophila sp. PSN 637]